METSTHESLFCSYTMFFGPCACSFTPLPGCNPFFSDLFWSGTEEPDKVIVAAQKTVRAFANLHFRLLVSIQFPGVSKSLEYLGRPCVLYKSRMSADIG